MFFFFTSFTIFTSPSLTLPPPLHYKYLVWYSCGKSASEGKYAAHVTWA
jgi:hypothetical protein